MIFFKTNKQTSEWDLITITDSTVFAGCKLFKRDALFIVLGEAKQVQLCLNSADLLHGHCLRNLNVETQTLKLCSSTTLWKALSESLHQDAT